MGTLVQATVDGTVPPIPFNQIQVADLKEWHGDKSTAGWRKLVTSLEALVGPTEQASPAKSRYERTSICVLPFANMSGDAEQEYFSDGISEDITTDLSKVSALEVIARNTAFQFKGQSFDVCDIAKKLGVSHVLEGSVRKAGNRVRITAQLIDGAGGGHIWADRYDRELTDIFAIQDEISNAIVEALKVKLLPSEKEAIENRGTNNVDAYDLYLMARQTWIAGPNADSRREEAVIRMCDRVIEVAPDYGKAWALKALAQAVLHFGYNKSEDDDGSSAAQRAVELDPSLGEAYAVQARVLAEQRMFEEAETKIQCALNFSADSWEVNEQAAWIFYHAKKFPDAARHYERCIELMNDDRHSMEMLTVCYRAIGDDDGLRRTSERLFSAAERAVGQDSTNASAFAQGAQALLVLNEVDRAREWIDRALLLDPDNLATRYNFACSVLNYTDDLELAFEHLDFVFTRSVGGIIRRADMDVDLDCVRDHPRFRQIYEMAMERIAKLDAEAAAKATG
jgi:adenylate cyclase